MTSDIRSTSAHQQNYLIHFLTLPLKFAYLLCLSPFYLTSTKFVAASQGIAPVKFCATTWLPQKLTCGFLTLLDIVWILRFIRKALPTEQKNPSQHIETVIAVISQVYKVVTFYKLWMNQHEFERLANFTSKTDLPLLQSRWWKPKLCVYLFIILYVLLGLSYMDWVSGKIDETSDIAFSIEQWWQMMVTEGKYNFYMSGATQYSYFVETVLGTFAAAGLLHRLLINKNFAYYFL